ncbi:hypothetical protein PPERSA_11340 [Pseudocohnilembus persalinus]|uniref:Uncharacterized protein n=1 Tax=Pseudocohnilembus persalinus TaxID=266149 RepID=A0A0V0QQ39_PSEPJ|nr:hypothetical protein PPERSA_11340 [Pseudocohnilembus persalinus]|eukprot:KRX04216.1 hypothetical protein PPERSA_11340 [Pseudocohnilembus persalinus]
MKKDDLLYFVFYLLDHTNDNLLCQNDCINLLYWNEKISILEQDFIKLYERILNEMKNQNKIFTNYLDKPLFVELLQFKDELTYSQLVLKTRPKQEVLSYVNDKKITVYRRNIQSVLHNFDLRQRRDINEQYDEKYVQLFMQHKKDFQEYSKNRQKKKEFFIDTLSTFSLNFSSFKQLYRGNQFQFPSLLYDVIQVLTLIKFPNVDYKRQLNGILKAADLCHLKKDERLKEKETKKLITFEKYQKTKKMIQKIAHQYKIEGSEIIKQKWNQLTQDKLIMLQKKKQDQQYIKQLAKQQKVKLYEKQ